MNRLLALLTCLALALPAIGQPPPKGDGRTSPDGSAQVQLDLPDTLHLRNKAGTDRQGLCVFTSINHSAYWQNLPALQDFRDYMTKFPGGGWPEKVDRMIEQRCKALGVPKPAYIQVQSNNLDILAAACKSGRMPAITFCRSFMPGRYGGQTISHMVTLVAARVGPNKMWACLDNNYPEELEWLTEAQFLQTYSGGRTGWAVIFLSPGSPPPPRNHGGKA